MQLPLENVVSLPDQTVAKAGSVDLQLPAMPARAGRVAVLRLRAFIRSRDPGGCNYNARIDLNGTPLGRDTAAGGFRLIGRSSGLELSADRNLGFPVFSDGKLMLMYAPSADVGDTMTTDGLGATFLLDVSDLVRGVDGNTLTLRNEYRYDMEGEFGALCVHSIEVGWLDRQSVPTPAVTVPERGPIAAKVAANGVELAQSTRGGFAVRGPSGHELLVETGLGMASDAPSTLLAEDGAQAEGGPQVVAEPWGPAGFRVTATWPTLRLSRTLCVRDGLVRWSERWTNTSDATIGVPFRHRLFIRGEAPSFCLGGSPDNIGLPGSAVNPTLFIAPARDLGRGFGLVAESDWLRLLMELRAPAGVGEVFTTSLALAAGSSIDFELTIAPVEEGGYWRFINGVRERWGLNGIRQERPVFWGYAKAAGLDAADAARRALGNLGPITVVLGPWQRLQVDADVLRPGGYPKLPADAPRAPGACPDLDVDAFTTFAHREPAFEALKAEVVAIREAVPDIRLMQMLHPSMEAVYRPLQGRWPFASEAIQTAAGGTFEDAFYSKAWLADWVQKDWGVLYYVPRPGSAYLHYLLAGMDRALDELQLDGLYSDEFSWAYGTRGYSRYDYSRWDGYSADLDPEGKVLRLKSDNAHVTESCQLQMIDHVLRRGRYFLTNGGCALRSVCQQPHARFIEGGGGSGSMGYAHLSPVPLILGNMGDETTRAGVLASVRECLRHGCLYSPTAVNLLLEGPDNFVCKLYPMTIDELGPGYIIGRERVVAMASRSFAWPAEWPRVRQYRYDAAGTLVAPPAEAERTGDTLEVQVPDGGLVIVEAPER